MDLITAMERLTYSIRKLNVELDKFRCAISLSCILLALLFIALGIVEWLYG